MRKNILSLVITTILLFVVQSHAGEDDLVSFDLSLAGYRIGMTYDDATSVRPFDSVRDLEGVYNDKPYFQAEVGHIYVDDVEMHLSVAFADGKVQKIICKTHPSIAEDIVRRLNIALGQCEDKSKTITSSGAGQIRQTIYKWNFPNANMTFYGSPVNNEFSVVSLVAKKEKKQAEQDTLKD